MNELSIRQATLNDLPELQLLFVNTISTICIKDYTPEQIKVWTSGIENHQRWQSILTDQYVRIAEHHNKIVGFASLDKGNHIDLMYTHQHFQGKGIATELYNDLEKEAQRQGNSILHTNASKTAKHFFERKGFQVIAEQIVVRQEIELTNFKMTKQLA